MPQRIFEIQVNNLTLMKLLSNKFGKKAINFANQAMIENIGRLIQTEIKIEEPVDTGEAQTSIEFSIFSDPIEITGVIKSESQHAWFVEVGRNPGKFPPRDMIAAWCERKLGDASLSFLVARKIARRGILPRNIFKKVAEKYTTSNFEKAGSVFLAKLEL